MLLLMWCAFTILRKRVRGLWGDLCGKIFLLWFGLILIPCGLLLFLFSMLTQFLPAAAMALNGLILVYLYLAGVYATGNLYCWYQKSLK